MPYRFSDRFSTRPVLALLASLSLVSLSCSTDSPMGTRPPMAFSVLPVGTSETRVAAGLISPTAMALAPDGRIFVAEQCGTLRVVKNGALLPTAALTLPVDCTGERGLLGIAIDPGFLGNQRIYLYYTVSLPPVHNRVSQFTLVGDAAGNEQILYDLDDLGTADFHNGGAIHFAPDGTLYIAVGDNGTSSNAQSLTTTFGKILRINTDGSIPADNPFFGSTTGRYQAIWALGLRNPFTFAFQPGTGRLFINDVGETAVEEVNDGVAGANYGWPTCEGPCQPSRSQFKDPFFSYTHQNGCAVTGGTFYSPSSTRFPSSYLGTYMFADYCGGYISVLNLSTRSASQFSSGMLAPVDLQASSDGGLYYLQRGNSAPEGELWRVDGTTNQSPIITAQPTSVLVSVGQPATFTVTATGTAPLTYQWRRDGTPIGGATSPELRLPVTTLADSGAVFTCVVTNDFASVPTGGAVLSVTTNLPPVATITSPETTFLYKGGQTITYAATATDPETGAIPASGYSWEVVFHHDTHVHPFIAATSGSTSGSFQVPTTGEKSANVWFAILLTVTDAAGLTTTVERDVFPLTSTLTLQSTPSAAQVTLDGQPVTTPFSVLGVAGVERAIGAVAPQTIAGLSYTFLGWSDGGGPVHTISTPDTNATFTATYTAAAPSTSVSFLQANANTAVSAATLTVPLASTTAAGNILVVGIDWSGSGTFGSITDAQGNVWVPLGTQQATPRGVKSRFYYAPNIKGGTETVTVTLTGADPSLQVYVAEYAGADPTNPIDGTSQRTGTAGAVTSGQVTTTTANDMLVGFCVGDGTCSPGSGWNARSTHSNNLLEDRVQATAGLAEAVASSNSGWSMVLAAIRPYQGPPTPVASVTVAGATSVQVGQSIQLTATLRDAAGNLLVGRAVTWSSGNTGIATVSTSGLVTGIQAGGPVQINAVSEGIAGGLGITVTAPPPPTPVTASVTAADKVFDGTTTAVITSCTLSGAPAGVTCSAGSATFSDPNIGTGKTVTATGITLGGPNATGYALTSTIATTTASILSSPPPSTNVTFAQANAATGVSATSLTVTLPNPTNAGSLVVVGINWNSATFGSISDGQGNTFVQVGAQQSTPGGIRTRFYYAKNIRGGTEAVTVTMSAADPSLQVYMAEYRGADITTPLDVFSQATGTSGTVSTPAVTTTSTNDQLVAFCVSNGTCSLGSGWTARSTHSNNLLEDRTQATLAPVSGAASSNNSWSMFLAAFRPQQAPATPVASVTVSGPTSVQAGQTIQLTATMRDANGTTLTGRNVTWSSASAALATVSATGVVTGVSPGGPVTITATSEGIAGTLGVMVTAPPPPTPVTASVTAADKVFDGTTTATITSCTLSGSPAGVTCSAAAASFSDPNVGTGKTVTATGITLGGVNAVNFVLTSATATTTASITALPPPTGDVTFAQANAATGVSATSLTVPLASATTAGSVVVVGLNFATSTFSSISDAQGNTFVQVGTQQLTPGGIRTRLYYAKNIRGGSESVTVTLAGADPSLQVYVAEYRGADISNPLDVTSQATGGAGSVSSGTVTTTSSNDRLIGFCVADGSCTVGSGWTARSTHSNNLLEDRTQATPAAVSAIASANNGWSMFLAALRPQQAPATPVASVTVAPASSTLLTGQTVQLSATTRDANGTLLTGRTVSWSSSAPSVATVSASGLVTAVSPGGPVTVTATSEGIDGTASVTVNAPPPPTPVTASVTAADKLYDGTTSATITSCTLSGSPAGVTCAAAGASFSDASPGTGKTVTATGITLGGANAAGYVLTATTATTTADILPPIPVTASVTAADKVFDGTTAATITSCALSGSPAGVTCSAAAANFSDAAIGTGKTVTATGISLGGPNAASYLLTSTTATTTADITAVPTAVSFVQANARSVNGSSNAMTLTSATASGNLLVVGVSWSGNRTLRSITDNRGNTYTQLGTQAQTSNGIRTRLYYARNIAGGSTTVTVTLSGSSSSFQVYGAEYAGASTTAPLDVTVQRTGTGTTITSGNAVTTAANARVVGFCVSDGTCNAGSGFAARSTLSNRLLEDRLQATAGTAAATATQTQNRSWVMIMAAFKP